MDSVAYRQARETLDSACAQGGSSLHERALRAAGRKKEMARAAPPSPLPSRRLHLLHRPRLPPEGKARALARVLSRSNRRNMLAGVPRKHGAPS